jgi:phage-related protein
VANGQNLIEEWYQKELSEDAQFILDALLKNLQKIDSSLNWNGFKYLQGKPKEERIWQLDFIADKRQYRLLGIFGVERKRAVLILGCYHKGDNYTPRDALETARKRARALREGRAETHERKIKSDS